jgi:NitT/TauT family transport system permease protein
MSASDRKLSTSRLVILTIAGAVAFLAIWYGAALTGAAPPQFLPMPHEVVTRLIRLMWVPFSGATLEQHLAASFVRFAFGFGLAAIVGVPLGLLMGRFGWLDSIVSPAFNGLRFVPPIAWVPFAALWMGTGIGGPVLIIFAGAFPPCVINAQRGVKFIDRPLLEASRTLGLTNLQVLTEVLFPAALPSIIAGLRISAGLGWMSLVGAELIVASSGIGNLLVKGQAAIDASIVMAGMIAIGVVGAGIDIVLRWLQKRLSHTS